MATVRIEITDTKEGINVSFCMNTELPDGAEINVRVSEATVAQMLGWSVIKHIEDNAGLAAETRQKLDSGMTWEQIKKQQDFFDTVMP